ncbi:MAG: 7-carboxy-7-deazaguanine synthase QueE [Pirellulaceae bacterium]|nr:7-carboxy-7-deazaguanine synthase QueE [Pirellulaceae bacterium]
MKICEIYSSRQGEGRLTGIESTFIRTSGCNLRCWFCDTPYASWQPEGDDLSVDQILDTVDKKAPDHIVITGGEPMLFAEMIPLCHELRLRGKHITIETAGTLYLPLACDLMSISPKLASSAPSVTEYPKWNSRHHRNRHVPKVIHQLINQYRYQLKFVVDQKSDCLEIEHYLEEFPDIQEKNIWLMPQGRTAQELEAREKWLKDYCLQQGFHYCPRKHIQWYGTVRGT